MLVAGWIVEEPTLSREQCAEMAKNEAVEAVDARVMALLPGDSRTDVKHFTTFENESADLAYVPVWILAARSAPDRPPVRIVINGQSGLIFGHAPLSAVRIVLAIALLIACAVALYLFFGTRPG